MFFALIFGQRQGSSVAQATIKSGRNPSWQENRFSSYSDILLHIQNTNNRKNDDDAGMREVCRLLSGDFQIWMDIFPPGIHKMCPLA